ncbi:hypothetical protein Plhal304r1_c025g0084811 [Plasmopara halstedii]
MTLLDTFASIQQQNYGCLNTGCTPDKWQHARSKFASELLTINCFVREPNGKLHL